MMTNKNALRYAAAALGMGALAVLGATAIVAVPSATTSVQAKAHPAAGSTYVAPWVPQMQLGQTEGEPTTTATAPNGVSR